jgi:hypothetical protein
VGHKRLSGTGWPINASSDIIVGENPWNDRSIERHGDARNGFGNRFAPAIDPSNLLQNRSRAKVRFTQGK